MYAKTEVATEAQYKTTYCACIYVCYWVLQMSWFLSGR